MVQKLSNVINCLSLSSYSKGVLVLDRGVRCGQLGGVGGATFLGKLLQHLKDNIENTTSY